MAQGLPITGVVGVLGGDARTVDATLESLERPGTARPDGVEVRADLFTTPRAALDVLRRLPCGIPVIFTVRLPGHGGNFAGDEASRIALYREALSLGARLVDAEWESEAARVLSRERRPLIASHHDFRGMLSGVEIERLTREMTALRPLALKLVPTAQHPADSVRMLEWVAGARPAEPCRIGFAMGEMGLASRVLSMARGAPLTYAALGGAVAPGQASVADMVDLYRASRLQASTRVLGVVGNPVAHSLSPHLHNPALQARGIDAVYLPLRLETFPELASLVEPLGIDGLSVTIPFKEDALRFSTEADERSRSIGAANTLIFSRDDACGKTVSAVRAYNTDYDGVLGPLSRHGIDPRGLAVAIIGNGGAARGAARALKDAGARITIFYRNAAKAKPVAAALGVSSQPLGELARGRHQLIVNATPLGLDAGDPSPAPAAVFDARTWAFDMIYDPPETPFLAEAKRAGARTIPGREMLVSQALVQFQLFTGREASHEELEASFLRGQASRLR